MFYVHMRFGDTMQTIGYRRGAKAWRMMQVAIREGGKARLQGPSKAIIA